MNDIDSIVDTAFALKDGSPDDLRDRLIAKIQWVLDHQLSRLPQYLYQIDVSEAKVNEAFQRATSGAEVPILLADLVLERVAEIMEARRRT